MSSFYATLRELPLFQGLSTDSLIEIIEKTQFQFTKLPPKAIITEQDSPCQELIYVLSGQISATRQNRDHAYAIEELHLKTPTLLCPERFLGMRTQYTHTFKAETQVHLLTLSKATILLFMELYPVFRLNFFNMISFRLQAADNQLWSPSPQKLEHRFTHFILSRSLYPAGVKSLRIEMKRLAEELNDTRLNVSHMLRNLRELGLISQSRCLIQINHLEALMSRLKGE